MKKIILLCALLLLFAAAVIFFYSFQKKQVVVEKNTGEKKMTASTSAETVKPDTKVKVRVTKEGTVMRYTSPRLGITFTYIDNGITDSSNIYIMQKENTVCVTYDVKDDACEEGQSVAVFSKKKT